jgi:GntR family transcriptional regulator
VLRAYAELRDEHLVEVRRGRGVTVLAPPDRARPTNHVRNLVEAARNVGLTDPEIHDLVRRYL